MNKDELMQMARDAQVIGGECELEAFANAILERAAKLAEDAICDCCWGDGATGAAEHIADEIRALKINAGG